MSTKKKLSFTTTDVDGKDLKLDVKYPSLEQQEEGQSHYNRAFAKAIRNEAILRAALDKVMISQGIWDDAKSKRWEELETLIKDAEKKLRKGGMTKAKGRDLAIELIRLRAEQTGMLSERRGMDSVTAEGQADNTRFDYYVSVCTVYNNTGEPYFKDLRDYLERTSETAAGDAARNLMALMYGVETDYRTKLPENQFLQKYGFIDEKFRFINKEKQLTDWEGRLIDEDGRYIDGNGNFVDKFGNRVDEEGELSEEQGEFYDEEAEPTVAEA